MIDEKVLAWMAGFVDGEGSISINTVSKTKSFVPKSIYFRWNPKSKKKHHKKLEKLKNKCKKLNKRGL